MGRPVVEHSFSRNKCPGIYPRYNRATGWGDHQQRQSAVRCRSVTSGREEVVNQGKDDQHE